MNTALSGHEPEATVRCPSEIQASGLRGGFLGEREESQETEMASLPLLAAPAPASSRSPPPTLLSQVIYTERFESRQDHDSSSINLIRCTRFYSTDTSQATSDEQVPYTISSTSHRNQGQNYEDVDKVWLPKDPSRNSSMPPPDAVETQERNRSLVPILDTSLLVSIHTIILDFSMVHFVDSRASVSLRQVRTEEAFTRARIPSYHCPPHPPPP